MTKTQRLLQILAPHPSVVDLATARRIRALAAGSLTFAILDLIYIAFCLYYSLLAAPLVLVGLVVVDVLMIMVYVLVRTRHYRWGNWLFLLSGVAIIQLRPLIPHLPPERIVLAMPFVAMLQTTAVLVLEFRAAMIFLPVNLALMSLVFVLRPDVSVVHATLVVMCVVCQSIMTALLAYISKLERDLAARASAASAVAEIVAGVAHALNSPMAATTAIVASLERRLSSDQEHDPQAQPAWILPLVGKASRTLERSQIIAKSLQHFVEPEDSKSSKSMLVLTDCVDEAIDHCRHAFNAPHVQVDFPREACAQLRIYCHRTRFIHAITNLLSSCFKVLLTASEPVIRIAIAERTAHITLRIGDSSGSDLTTVRKLIEDPLHDSSTMDKGSDLELRIAERLFGRCDAQLKVGSEVATEKFIITLPAA